MNKLVEIRSYTLKPSTRARFHQLVQDVSLPMLRRWEVDVVSYGPSTHDDDSYYLIRCYENLDDRQASQDRLYGSDEWRDGPREAIVSLIENYTSVTIDLDAAAIDLLRKHAHARG